MRGRGRLNFSHQTCWLSKYCLLQPIYTLKQNTVWESELPLTHTSSNMSRVLVTGASGYVAMHIVKQLIESGKYIVRGTVRNLANEKKVQPLKDLCPQNAKYPLELVEADLLKKETWPDAVKDCTYVIHVASPFPAQRPKDEMEVIGPAVEGTKNVLDACAKTKGGVKRVVLTSSCAAIYPGNIPSDRVLTEEDWAVDEGISPYEKSKLRAEKTAWELVKNLPDDEKFELSCINPGLVFGPVLHGSSCTSMEFHLNMLHRGAPFIPKMSLPFSDVRDVAAAHITAMTSPKSPGNRYITITKCAWFEEAAKMLDEEFRPLGYDVPSEVKELGPTFNHEVKLDNSKVKADLGFQPRDFKASVIEMAYNLIESGFIKKTPKYEEIKGGKSTAH